MEFMAKNKNWLKTNFPIAVIAVIIIGVVLALLFQGQVGELFTSKYLGDNRPVMQNLQASKGTVAPGGFVTFSAAGFARRERDIKLLCKMTSLNIELCS